METVLAPQTSRVLFGTRGDLGVEADGAAGALTVAAPGRVLCAIDAKLGPGPARTDLVQAVRAERQKPVLVVSAPNMRDGAVTVPAKLDPASAPLAAPRGGTGVRAVAQGRLLAGAAAGAQAASLVSPAGAAWAPPDLRVASRVAIGGAQIRVGADAYGRPALLTETAGGAATNMAAPLLSPPAVAGGAVQVAGATLAMQVAAGFPVEAFFAWSATAQTLNRAGVVEPGAPGVLRSGRVRFRGATASFAVTAAPGTYRVFGVLRDARGTCSPVAAGTMTIA